MKDSEKLDFFYEWAVWAHLSSKIELELILLKGHLMLETMLEVTLRKNNIKPDKNYSFYRKLTLLGNLTIENPNKELIVDSLTKINLMRNKVAHEFFYSEVDSELEEWSKNIHDNLKGVKFSKYTYRTKIVHAFSILAFNLLRLKEIS